MFSLNERHDLENETVKITTLLSFQVREDTCCTEMDGVVA